MWTLILFYVFNLVDGCVVHMFCRVVCEQSYLFPFMVILSLSVTCCVFMRTFRVRVHFPWVESYISYKTAHNHSCTSVCSISNLS